MSMTGGPPAAGPKADDARTTTRMANGTRIIVSLHRRGPGRHDCLPEPKPPYCRSHDTVMTLGVGSMTASFTSRPLSTTTKLLTIGKGTPATYRIDVPVQSALTS